MYKNKILIILYTHINYGDYPATNYFITNPEVEWIINYRRYSCHTLISQKDLLINNFKKVGIKDTEQNEKCIF